MRIHHTSPPNHQITMALHSFAADVFERSSGQIVVDIVTKRTGRSVVNPVDYVSSVVSGEIEAASMPTFMWSGIPEMNFSLIPYYFTRANQVRNFPNSDAAALLERKINDYGVQTLSWIHVTRKTVFTSNEKPIVFPEDFNGLTIVALNEFSEKPFETVGADPVLVYSPDVYDAVTSGEANAIMTDVSSATGLKFYEIQKYATVAPFFSAYYHLFVSPDWLAGLSTQNRKAVLDAGQQLNIDSFLITEARAAASPDVLREGGMIVHEQTADEQEAWKRVMSQPSMKTFLESSPDSSRLISLLDDI